MYIAGRQPLPHQSALSWSLPQCTRITYWGWNYCYNYEFQILVVWCAVHWACLNLHPTSSPADLSSPFFGVKKIPSPNRVIFDKWTLGVAGISFRMSGSWTLDRFLSGCICVFLPVVVFVPSAFAVEQGVITLSVDRHPWTGPVCSPAPSSQHHHPHDHHLHGQHIPTRQNPTSIRNKPLVPPEFSRIFKMSLPGPDFC